MIFGEVGDFGAGILGKTIQFLKLIVVFGDG